MHSPPIEWALLAGHFVALDVVRDRGEPDGDTASEVLRTVFHVDKLPGRVTLGAFLAAGAVTLYRHLVKEIT